MSGGPLVERIARDAVAADCPVCRHPRRKLLECDLYFNGASNSVVATRYGIAGGRLVASEIVRQHRAAGHMLPREELRGSRRELLIDEAKAIEAEREAGA